MVAPACAWSVLPAKFRHLGPTGARLLIVAALLYPAFRLHDRAGEVEQRERSLKQMMEVVSRRERVNNDRERDLRALAARLEHESQANREGPPRELLPILVDHGVRQAGFETFESPVKVRPAAE
jgi:hypothetical protein